MARIRSIKPEFWVSEQIAECSTNARLTFVGLWNFCDDNGVHPAKPKTLKAELFPMDDFSAADVVGWMQELVRAGLVVEYEVDGEPFWHVTGWAKHQKIDRPSAKYPLPAPLSNSTSARRADSPSNRETFDESSPNARRAPPPGMEGNGKEGSGGGDSSTRRRSPSRARSVKTAMPNDFGVSDRVRAWAAEKGFDQLDQHLEAFRGKATARGYAYVDWDAAFQEAIREDWAGLRSRGVQRDGPGRSALQSILHADDNLAELGR